ncbi:MAG: major capsid protein [Xanthomonadaceae bacterium]|nr:major capsid protein [Xanthomonadaceae bacterium]
MVAMNVFDQDPFTTISLTTAVEKAPYVPNFLDSLKLFEPEPQLTEAVAVEERDGVLSLIPISPLGAPPTPRATELRKLRYFNTVRLATEATIRAVEVRGIRDFGRESALMQVQKELARRLSGPTGAVTLQDYTMEYHRLGAIQGVLLDAGGSTIRNWFTEFGISAPSAIAFALTTTNAGAGSLRPLCNQVTRTMWRAAKGAFLPTTKIHALCGDEFWDNLTNHIDVRDTYLNWSAAVELRQGNAWETYPYGGIHWTNYRGSDDGSTIAVPTNSAYFFPQGAPGVFKVAYSPAEGFPWVSQPGKKRYIIPVKDRDRGAWFKSEVYSYNLHICTRPEVLQNATG